MLMIGQQLYGYCGGLFLPFEHYGDKRVEAVGVDWVVVREKDGTPSFAHGADIHDLLAEHTKPPKDENV